MANNPLLTIPKENKYSNNKGGGPEKRLFYTDPADFIEFKDQKVKEIESLHIEGKDYKYKVGDDMVFFQINLNPSIQSKSNIPKTFFSQYNLDLYGKGNNNNYKVSTTNHNLQKFKTSINSLTIESNEKDSMALTTIQSIKLLPKSDFFVNIQSSDLDKEGDVKSFLYFHDTINEKVCKEIVNNIVKETHKKVEYIVTSSGAKIAYGTFQKSFLNEISSPNLQNPFQKVEKSVEYVSKLSKRQSTDLKGIKLNDLQTGAIVAVVDGGISEDNIMKDLVIGRKSFVEKDDEDLLHGSFVASRIIFGNEIFESVTGKTATLDIHSKVVDIKVLNKYDTTSDKEVYEAILKAIEEFPDIKVFNLSIGLEEADILAQVLNNKKCFLTRELDALAYKNNIIFVYASGNNNDYQNYPTCLEEEKSVICSPADAYNGVTVGSIADKEADYSLASKGELSPFTRSAPLYKMLPSTGACGATGIHLRKPDVVHYGGNTSEKGITSSIGVWGIGDTQDTLIEDTGTSYASPLVSQILAKIYAELKNNGSGEYPQLAKALLLHTSKHGNPSPYKRGVGFGLPNYNTAIECLEGKTTLIFCDKLGKDEKLLNGNIKKATKHRIKFHIPEEFKNKDKKIGVKGTLCIFTPVSTSSDSDYAEIDINMNLHYLNSNGASKSAGLTSSSEDLYNIKWHPIKHFEKHFSGNLIDTSKEREIWLEITGRGGNDKLPEAIPYALVVTIEDMSQGEKLDIYQIYKERYKQYIPLKVPNKVKV